MARVVTTSSTTAGDNITLASSEDLYVGPFATRASETGIGIAALFTAHAIDILGDVFGETDGLLLGATSGSFTNSRVAIGPDASVTGRIEGLASRGSSVTVVNAGYINGNSGLRHDGTGFNLFNSGTITGSFSDGVRVDGTGLVTNTGLIASASNGTAVLLINTSNTGTAPRLINHGTIVDDSTAISGDSNDANSIRNWGEVIGNVSAGNAGDLVVNGGLVDGDVSLGGGDDRYIGREGRVTGSVSGAAGADTLIGGDRADTLSGGDDADSIAGGGGDDSLDGGTGDDRVSGGDGDDVIEDASGLNTLLGGAGDDAISGGGQNDLLQGGTGDDILLAGFGRDTLNGGDGADRLDGGGNVDTLAGGRGDDEMTGGGATDVFVIGRAGGDDRITDFTDGVDDLDLTAFGFAAVAEVRALARDVTGGLLIDLTDVGGGTALLEGFSRALLTGDDLIL